MAGFTAALFAFVAVAAVSGQDYQDYPSSRPAPRYLQQSNDIKPTPVPILKQINRHNEDGSYTYGFEAADGSFKIETKLANGEVKGKYGYTDTDTGKVRVVEYGANKYGFQPSGEGITVAPPTLVDESRLVQEEPNLEYRGQQSSAPRRPAYRPAAVQQADYDQYDESPLPPARASAAAYSAPAYTQPAPAPYVAPGLSRAKSSRPSFFQGASIAQEQPSFEYVQSTARPEPYFRPAPQAGQFAQSLYTQTARPQYTQAQYTQAQYESPTQYTPTQFNQPARDEAHIQYSPSLYRQAEESRSRAPAGRPSLLDQLMKEFALPEGGSAPLHDITFGTY